MQNSSVRCGSQQLNVIVHLCSDYALHVMLLSGQGQELDQIRQVKGTTQGMLNVNRQLAKQHLGTISC